MPFVRSTIAKYYYGALLYYVCTMALLVDYRLIMVFYFVRAGLA